MATYSLLASESTVQVLSTTVVNDVVYCTIHTQPQGAIVSMPVQASVFNAGGAGPELTALADGIETMFGRGHVIGAVGSQRIDANGLLADYVSFTVEYVPASPPGTSITATADVPVGLLNQTDPVILEASLNEAEAIIQGVYTNLQNAATG